MLTCWFGWHSYEDVGSGISLHRYWECRWCGKRIIQQALEGYQPKQLRWLAGGAWDDHRPPPPGTK